MYTEYGYIGEDGIEYATEQEAYEAQTDNDEQLAVPLFAVRVTKTATL